MAFVAATGLSAEQKEKIVQALQSRGVNNPCPRCGSKTFSLIDGYFNQPINIDLAGGMVIGGPSIPSVVTACNKCGFLSQHALGALGLLPSEGGKK